MTSSIWVSPSTKEISSMCKQELSSMESDRSYTKHNHVPIKLCYHPTIIHAHFDYTNGLLILAPRYYWRIRWFDIPDALDEDVEQRLTKGLAYHFESLAPSYLFYVMNLWKLKEQIIVALSYNWTSSRSFIQTGSRKLLYSSCYHLDFSIDCSNHILREELFSNVLNNLLAVKGYYCFDSSKSASLW